MTDLPFVAIGHSEVPPWGNDCTCPTCGEPDLPLKDSVPPVLTYIAHCGGVWVRGPIRLRSAEPEPELEPEPEPEPATETQDRA